VSRPVGSEARKSLPAVLTPLVHAAQLDGPMSCAHRRSRFQPATKSSTARWLSTYDTLHGTLVSVGIEVVFVNQYSVRAL
jgi:hypothetical protein